MVVGARQDDIPSHPPHDENKIVGAIEHQTSRLPPCFCSYTLFLLSFPDAVRSRLLLFISLSTILSLQAQRRFSDTVPSFQCAFDAKVVLAWISSNCTGNLSTAARLAGSQSPYCIATSLEFGAICWKTDGSSSLSWDGSEQNILESLVSTATCTSP